MTAPARLLIALTALLLALGRFERAWAEDGDGTIVLAPGEQKTLPGDGVDSFSAATGDVLEVRITAAPDGRQQLILVGKAPGTTSLVIGLTNGRRLTYQVTVSRIRARHNVQLDVYFVQMSRSRATRIGLAWPGSVGASVQGSLQLGTSTPRQGTLTISSSVLPRLDFAAEQGWAKVLDHSKVVMANGDEGTYASGGDVNIQVATGLTAGLEKVQFGSTVKARVSYDPTTGRVEVRLDADLSRLTDGGAGEVPGVARTRVATTVNMGLGESLALGGLYSIQERTSSSGLAFLSEIPVLGYLFGARARSREQLENVVFIVPSLVSPISVADRDRVGEALRVYRGYEGGPLGARIKQLRTDAPARPEATP